MKTRGSYRSEEEGLSSLATTAIEMNRLQKLRQKSDFYCKVVDVFVLTDRRDYNLLCSRLLKQIGNNKYIRKN